MSYRFGPFELHPDRYRLVCSGEDVPAEPQTLEVLAYFLRHPNRLVTKDELLAEVWDGQIVSDSAVSRAVSEVRRLLAAGPDGDAARGWIQTVYGRGFAYEGPAVERLGSSGGATATTPGDDGVRPGLPVPLTPLIGRERELEQVCALLRTCRLLTLTGTGGAGKTRLALEAARRSAAAFRHGAVFVALSEVTTADGLASALVRSLEVRNASREPLDAVRRHLASRQVLLVLDNFEQLVGCAGLVEDLLSRSPDSAALVTSRFVLRLEGEQEWPVPPLRLPRPVLARPEGGRRNAKDSSDDDAPDLGPETPAVALFLARARAALPRFEASGDDLAYVAEICRRLDGLPLAIELAAAQVKLFSPREIWERLTATFDLLSSPVRSRRGPHRHRTLQAALDWSHRLLEADEAALLRRLAVFAGDFPRSAVEPVCGDESLGPLASLVDRSLVERAVDRDVDPPEATAREPRFRLLETTRAFALERLRAAGEESTVRRAHARWAYDLAAPSEDGLKGEEQDRWLRRLDAEHDHLLAAVGWAERSADDLALGLRLATSLSRYWTMRSYREGRDVLERLLGGPGASEVEAPIRARARLALGMLCLLLGDYDAARTHLEEAGATFDAVGDRARRAEALDHLGWIAVNQDDLERAEELSRRALELHEDLGEDRGVAVSLNNLGWAHFFADDPAGADRHLLGSLEYRRRAGDRRGEAFALVNRAVTRLMNGPADDLDAVADWLRQAGERLDTLADRPLRSWLETARALLELAQGRGEAALERLEASLIAEPSPDSLDGAMWQQFVLARVHEGIGRTDDARHAYRQALDKAKTLGTQWMADACRRGIDQLPGSAEDPAPESDAAS